VAAAVKYSIGSRERERERERILSVWQTGRRKKVAGDDEGHGKGKGENVGKGAWVPSSHQVPQHSMLRCPGEHGVHTGSSTGSLFSDCPDISSQKDGDKQPNLVLRQ